MPKVNADQITTAETLFRQFSEQLKPFDIRLTKDTLINEDPTLIRRWGWFDHVGHFNLVIQFSADIEGGDPIFNVVIYGPHNENFTSSCRISEGGWPDDFHTQDGLEIQDVDQKKFFKFIQDTVKELMRQ